MYVFGPTLKYFTIPHIVSGKSDEMFGALLRKLGGAAATDLSKPHPAGKGSSIISNTTLAAAKEAAVSMAPSLVPCAAAKAAADALVESNSIPAANMQFFVAHVVYQTSLQHFAVQAVADLAGSIIALASNNSTGAVGLANSSMGALTELFAAQRRAEGSGQWRGLFSADRLPYTALQVSRRAVRKYHLLLLDPTRVLFEGGTPSGYYSFYDYQVRKVIKITQENHKCTFGRNLMLSMSPLPRMILFHGHYA